MAKPNAAEKSVLTFPQPHIPKRHPAFISRTIAQALVGDAGFTILPIILLLAVTWFKGERSLTAVIKEVPLATIVLLGLSLSQLVELQLRQHRGNQFHPQAAVRSLIFALILIAVLGTTIIADPDAAPDSTKQAVFLGMASWQLWALTFLLFSLTTYLAIHTKRENQFQRRRTCPNDLSREEYYLYLGQSIENARAEVLTIAEYYRKSGNMDALDKSHEVPLTEDMEGDLKRSLEGLTSAIGKLNEHCMGACTPKVAEAR